MKSPIIFGVLVCIVLFTILIDVNQLPLNSNERLIHLHNTFNYFFIPLISINFGIICYLVGKRYFKK